MTPAPRRAEVRDAAARRRAIGLSAEALARAASVSSALIEIVDHGYRPSRDIAARIESALAAAEADAGA